MVFACCQKIVTDFWPFVEQTEKLFAFCRKNRNNFRNMLKKFEHFSHFVKRIEIVFAFCQQK